MSEELDFEAEISSVSNVETLSITEVDAPNGNALQFDPDEVVKDTIQIHSNTEKVMIDADDTQSNWEEIENDTVEVQSCNKDNESDISINQSDASEIQCDAIEIQCDAGEIQSDTGEIQSDAGEIQSDAGEIQSDAGEVENSDNLEEGEIKDNAPISNKNPEESVCWFFQKGNCLYGSECRNLHVSNKVYNMFEPVLSNKDNSNSLQLQNANVPAVLRPFPVPLMSDFESPWERGIKKAKIVLENANFRKNNQDDIENDWLRCLEVAKKSIQQKTKLKRQVYDDVKPHSESKGFEPVKFRERESENKIFKTNCQKSPLYSYCKYKKESNYEKKTNCSVEQTPDHLKWVDPWRRSKSPRKRTKSFSLTPSPSMKRSRKGSFSSSSSSSSWVERIYGSPHKSKSPKRLRSTSRSSTFSRSKKNSTFKKCSHSRGRSYSKSNSRSPRKSLSKSSRKSCCSGSYSSSRSSSVSSDDLYAQKKSTVKTKSANKLVPKNESSFIPAKNSKDVYRSSFIKSSFNKASGRVSSPCHSEKSSSSDLSVSSLSCTSISSGGKGTLHSSHTKATESNAFSRSNIDEVPRDRSRGAPKSEQEYQKSNAFYKHSKVSHKRLLSPDKKKLLMCKDTSSKTKGEAANLQVLSLNKPVKLASKPPTTKNVTTPKHSKAAEELLKYYSFAHKKNSSPTLTPAAQLKTTIPLPTETTKSTTASEIPNCQTKESEKALSKITLDVQIKPQKPIDPAVLLKLKEAGSKRRLLLQQLQAIEDAIARKKQPSS